MGDEETFGLIEEMEDEIVDKILPVREGDKKNSCILEVSQAAGGSESSLFAEEILLMYKNFARKMGWSMKEESFQKDMAIDRGCKYANYVIEGEGSYAVLKHEGGVHKV